MINLSTTKYLRCQMARWVKSHSDGHKVDVLRYTYAHTLAHNEPANTAARAWFNAGELFVYMKRYSKKNEMKTKV
jgi:hypothetical protein